MNLKIGSEEGWGQLSPPPCPRRGDATDFPHYHKHRLVLLVI